MTSRIAVTAALAAALLVPAGASADTTLTLNGPAAKSLRAQGVTIYEQLPARGIGSRIELPVAGGKIGAMATIEQQGQLRFKRGKRKLILESLRVTIGPGRQTLSALHGGRRLTIFAIRNGHSKPRLNVAAATAKLTRAKLRFTSAAAKLLRSRLGKLPNVKLDAGTIKVRAKIAAGPAGFVRPATAVDIKAATISWHVKESLIQYIASGEGTAASAGATEGPAAGDGLVYDFTFAPRSGGWYDPVSHTADVLGQGTVRFRYSQHGIDVSVSDPEIELNGAGSRLVASDGSGTRSTLFGLAATNPAAGAFGPANLAGVVLDGAGGSLFGGFYAPGTPVGYVTVSFST